MKLVALYFMAALYVFAGIMHFVKPESYTVIMPPYLPAHRELVFWSGVVEATLGVGLLFPATRSWAATGIILLLIAVFPANLYMATSEKFLALPRWLVWGRLPLQGLLIWWAWGYVSFQVDSMAR